MSLHRLRPYTTVIMMIAFLIVVVTGIILFFAPHGPGGMRQWIVLGLSKHQFKDIHVYLGTFGVLLVFFHLYLNWKAIKKYLCCRSLCRKHPATWGIGICACLVIAAVQFGT
ncbi:MAG: hypothetical protein CENE_02864 [Candidatus Celerinatantimonas neptuna]|nr:MAG: hypothetical protein CENE_02864 [Candidatus Celerinatantimonas neptuna]